MVLLDYVADNKLLSLFTNLPLILSHHTIYSRVPRRMDKENDACLREVLERLMSKSKTG